MLVSAPGSVHVHTFRELCTYLYESRPLLVSLPYRSAQDLKSIPFARLGSLRLDTLAHALLRVKNTTIISGIRLSLTLQSKKVLGSIPRWRNLSSLSFPSGVCMFSPWVCMGFPDAGMADDTTGCPNPRSMH